MDRLSNLVIPKPVKTILKRIMQYGQQGYIVGGAIRNAILGIDIKDWDIATSLKPQAVEELFKDAVTIPTGKRFGTITVIINNMEVEVTTFRGEEGYTDLRHPEQVTFISDITSDLARRDFTINAMAYNPYLNPSLLDPYKGINDIKTKTIRAVGEPCKRFNEDPLRMMRGIRFASELGFTLHEVTFKAISAQHQLISHISKERIRDELNKILISSFVGEGLSLLQQTGLLSVILPQLHRCFDCPQENPYHVYDVGNHILHVVENTSDDLILRLSALFHDIGKPSCKTIDEKGICHFYNHARYSSEITRKVMTNLRYDNKTIRQVANLVDHHQIAFDLESKKIAYRLRKLLGTLRIEDTFRLMELRRADILAQSPEYRDLRLDDLDKMQDMLQSIIDSGDPVSISSLAINGKDLIETGIGKTDARDIGKALNQAYEWVLRYPHWNEKELLLIKLQHLYR